MEGLIMILVVAVLLITGWWLVALLSSSSESNQVGFISYSKFKKIIKLDEWEAPIYHDNGVLIKDNFYTNRLCVESASYVYDGKVMIPMTPYDLFMINKEIKKTVLEKKFKGKKEKKKLFIW